MIELRWVERKRPDDEWISEEGIPHVAKYLPERVLQYRTLQGYMDASGAFNVARAEWSDWTDVPVVKEASHETK